MAGLRVRVGLAAAVVPLLWGGTAVAGAHGAVGHPRCVAPASRYQREIERFLHLVSWHRPPRCRHRWPAGAFRPVAREVQALEALVSPYAYGGCPVARFPVACVDRSRRPMWVRQGSRVFFGPARVRRRYPVSDGMYRVRWEKPVPSGRMYVWGRESTR
jgi:hypothetical protein